MIDKHSLLPFCTPFLDPDRVTHLREDMCGDTKEGVRRLSLFTALSMHLPEFLRFCSLCVQKDKKQFGECYWYRLHQLPGVEVCPIHNVFLDKSKARARSRRLSLFCHSPERENSKQAKLSRSVKGFKLIHCIN
jgi:hypothetical protein